ncbi:MAG: hypothetical protein NZ920_01805 [Aigarchaeota archaeon]|nr:hypothetical protein [Aigarchaeota archaeon]MDW8093178.1 cyclophilin-like family protein [Nitrososphaerota archaeon]
MFEVEIEVEIEGTGRLRGELKRYLAPMTFSEIVRRLPISGVAAKWDYAVYVITELKRGAEKVVDKVREGDVIYCPPVGGIAFVFKAGRPMAQSVRIGSLLDEVEPLERVREGARVIIRQGSPRSSSSSS